jgi:Ca2+-binding RTX toxin-like protein
VAKPLAADKEQISLLLGTLDGSLDPATFDRIWTAAGETDQARATSLVGYLSRTLLGNDLAEDAESAPASETLAALQAFVADDRHRASVQELSGKSGAELAELAKTDAGYRYALLNLDSVAIVGNAAISQVHDAEGELDRFDPDSGEQNVSDAWLVDRAKLLAWKLSSEAGESSATIDGSSNWTFTDHRNPLADGTPYELQIKAADATATNTVVFGSDSGQILKGATGTDRIHAGAGDDIVRGNGGDDLIEGGRGDDLILGGAGNDELAGEQGADEIDGAAGNDWLRGGAGDDLLTGGRGDDRLEGGAGHDVYAIDAGDGEDSIIDADQDGEIQLDGQALTGGAAVPGGEWRSADGRVHYSFSGDLDAGTLTIASYGVAGEASGVDPQSVTQVEGWHNGDLGIVLGDGTTEAVTGTAPHQHPAVPLGAAEDLPAWPAGTSGSDGDGIVEAAPSNEDLGALFAQVTSLDAGTSIPLTAEAVHRSMNTWAGIAEAPDIPPAAKSAHTFGITANDIASALMDFHDASSDGLDQGHGWTAPAPAPVHDVLGLLQTSSQPMTAQSQAGGGIGQRHLT